VFGTLLIIYIFYQHIIPVCEASVVHFDNRDYYNIFLALCNAGIPCAYVWLTVFWMIFHALLNFYAELTRFADCRFYSDWWNAGNLSEYWRKWNYPIHNWLVRHVYYPLIRRGINSSIARLLTFSVSAIFHEYIVAGSFRVLNFMAFGLMIVNIPVISI
jgi:diacylglycerol O-acyltransferase-1